MDIITNIIETFSVTSEELRDLNEFLEWEHSQDTSYFPANVDVEIEIGGLVEEVENDGMIEVHLETTVYADFHLRRNSPQFMKTILAMSRNYREMFTEFGIDMPEGFKTRIVTEINYL